MGEAQTIPPWGRGLALLNWLPVARNLRDHGCFAILGTDRFGLSLGTYEGDPGTPVRGTRPSAEQLRTLNTGWSTNLSAAFGPGIGANWPWHSQYTGQVPGFGVAVGKSYEITRVEMLSW